MKGITKFAVSYPVTVLMITLAVCLLGVISYNRLGTDLFPNLKNPALYIELEAGERPSEEIEEQFVSNIEATASRQDGVTKVSSSTKSGSASIKVEYDWSQDMDAAFLDLQRSMTAFSSNEDISSFQISKYDANQDPVMIVSLSNKNIQDMNELRKLAENYMRSELVRIDGVADIQLNGEEEANIDISTNSYLLDAYGLTTSTIATKISSLNKNVSGGTIVENELQYTIKGVNLIEDLDDIRNIIVTFKETEREDKTTIKSPVYIKDVAKVRLLNKDPKNITRLNGERCLSISIYKENNYNTVNVVDNINKKLDEFRASMPNYKFNIINNQGDFINSSIGEVKESALVGIVLAMLILFIFLRKLNLTLIVSLSIPISIIATFNLMYFNNLTVNIMTLGGIALGAGMLIDNAIVVMENIYRHLELGKSPKDAAIDGAAEVGGAIISSTLTTIVVFLPIVYIQGAAGELFKEQAWTVSFSLISSLFVAILLIPMLASKFLVAHKSSTKSIQITGYGNFVGKLIDKRYTIIIISLVFLGIGYFAVNLLDTEFMPKTESKEFTTKITLSPGTRLEVTDRTTETLEELISNYANKDIEWIYSQVGPANTLSTSSSIVEGENNAQVLVKLKKGSTISADDIIGFLNTNYSDREGIEITYKKEQSSIQTILGTEGAPVIIEIKGEDLDIIGDYCTQTKNAISDIPGIYNIKTSMEDGAPEVNIKIDRLRTGIYGIDMSTIASQIEEKLNGNDAGSMETNGESVDINIRVPEMKLSDLKNTIITQGDKSYRLSEIAELEISSAPKEINRNNQNRIGKVTALLEKGYSLGNVTPAIKSKIAKIQYPLHYSASITGEEEKRAESFNGLFLALLLSVILVYMVMASQFESLRHPFTILLTIPIAGVGSVFAFLLTGTSLNIMAFIGVIMLAGIAVNDAILLVDATNQIKATGVDLKKSLMMAAQRRIRPIIMTTATTVLALLPMCFAFGEGASLRSPMAIAVIGGLITSTIMTMVVIPCVYYIIDKKNKNVRKS